MTRPNGVQRTYSSKTFPWIRLTCNDGREILRPHRFQVFRLPPCKCTYGREAFLRSRRRRSDPRAESAVLQRSDKGIEGGKCLLGSSHLFL